MATTAAAVSASRPLLPRETWASRKRPSSSVAVRVGQAKADESLPWSLSGSSRVTCPPGDDPAAARPTLPLKRSSRSHPPGAHRPLAEAEIEGLFRHGFFQLGRLQAPEMARRQGMRSPPPGQRAGQHALGVSRRRGQPGAAGPRLGGGVAPGPRCAGGRRSFARPPHAGSGPVGGMQAALLTPEQGQAQHLLGAGPDHG